MQTVYDLMCEVACKLAKKPVMVRLKIPATKGMYGECHAGPDGQVYIDLAPMLSDKTKLMVFLHEVAHARLQDFKPSMLYKMATGSAEASKKTNKYLMHEDQADVLAKKWISFGRSIAGQDAEFENVLGALYDYWEG